MKIKPLSDKVVVKPLEAEQKTASGIVIPDTAKEKQAQGEVIAVGPGKVKGGQRISISPPERRLHASRVTCHTVDSVFSVDPVFSGPL